MRREAEEKVLWSVHSPRVLVFCTHGFFMERSNAWPAANPLHRCGLALANANRRQWQEGSVEKRENDGILFGTEIVDLDLRATELVVLSCCDSSLGEARDGEGVTGLSQAFHLAGARSVMGTLWEVEDLANALLMRDFFRHLAEGKNKADALRSAQRERIRELREGRQKAAHPFYWGAVQLIGDWR
jgi:CHAT domain-containing protein